MSLLKGHFHGRSLLLFGASIRRLLAVLENNMEGEGLLKTVSLNDAHKMPMFGLGVWNNFTTGEALKATKFALQNGYRMIDTAAYYQ